MKIEMILTQVRMGWLVLAVAAALVGLFTYLTPPLGDDLCVAAYGIGDYIRFVREYYFGWGGRVVAHTFVFGFANLPDWLFDIFNGLAFAALVALAGKMVMGPGREGRTPAWVLAVLLALFVSQIPMFGEAMIWLSGSGNYLWTMVVILAFLLPYRWLAGGKDVVARHGGLGVAAMLLVGIVAGWTNENTGAAAWGVAGLLVLDALWQQRKTKRYLPPLWAVAGMAGQLIGFAAMALAPGNAVRMAHPNVQKAMAVGGEARVAGYLEHLQDYIVQPWPMVLMFAVFALIWWQRGILWTLKTSPAARRIVIWGLGAVAAVGILIIGPYVEQRALTGAWIFLAIGAVACVVEVRTVYPRLVAVWSVAVGALSVYLATTALASFWLLADQHALVEAELATCLENGDAVCLVTPYRLPDDRYMFVPRIAQIQPRADDVYNVCRAKRIGVPALRARYQAGQVF